MKNQEELYQKTLKDIEQLKKVQLATLELITTLEGLRKEQQIIVDRVTREVYGAVEESGKKKFTNETIRKAEINKGMAVAEEYQKREKDIGEMEKNVQKDKIEQEYLWNKVALNKEYLASLSTTNNFR